MTRVVGVHGIGQQYGGETQLLRDWGPALTDGILRARHRQSSEPDFRIAFYGDFFRPQPGGSVGLDGLPDPDEQEIADLNDVIAELIPTAVLQEALAVETMGTRYAPAPQQMLTRVLDRCFPFTQGALSIGELRQVRRYLREPQLKLEVDKRVAEAIGDATILIGHSLGSVVAYEYVRHHPESPVRLLVTLGSPLGLRMVRSPLGLVKASEKPDAVELNVSAWYNVRDEHDPVAAAELDPKWYPQAKPMTVDNGKDAHSVARYLDSWQVGEILGPYLAGASE